jgi:SAM-dependent methyltransferase
MALGLDVTVPNVARIYDYLLGGKDNFAADREAGEELRSLLPDAEIACRENRRFLRRAVRYLASDSGIGQFIDIGSGLPAASNTHEIAQTIRPDARVAYVDYDPVVVAHGRALLGSSPGVAVIDADLRRPGVIVGSQPLADLVDFSAPVAIVLAAVLHFIPDNDDPYGIVDILKSVMAPGSYLVISHATQDSISREETLGGMSVYDKASAPIVPRTYGGVLKFFDRMDLVDPGLVNISEWRSTQRQSSRPMRALIYGGVARKP